MPLLHRECEACGRRFVLLSLCGVVTNNDRDTDIEDLSCPDCGCTEAEAILGGAVLKDAVNGSGIGIKFPYRDMALGCIVESAAHRRQLLAERNWTATDGDLDWEREGQADLDATATAEREFEEEQDYLFNGPSRAEYHKAREVIAQLPVEFFERR